VLGCLSAYIRIELYKIFVYFDIQGMFLYIKVYLTHETLGRH